MHRFVWNLAWGSSDSGTGDESGSRLPSPPKVIPGVYQLRLTVDGQSKTQPLQVVMDPRSPATEEGLRKQFELAQQIYGEAVEARRTLAEIKAVQKQLSGLQQNAASQTADLKAGLAEAQNILNKIVLHKIVDSKVDGSEHDLGLQGASRNLASALHVVESGDRATPAGAIAVYKEASDQMKARTREWMTFQQTTLPSLNERLRQAGLAVITVQAY